MVPVSWEEMLTRASDEIREEVQSESEAGWPFFMAKGKRKIAEPFWGGSGHFVTGSLHLKWTCLPNHQGGMDHHPLVRSGCCPVCTNMGLPCFGTFCGWVVKDNHKGNQQFEGPLKKDRPMDCVRPSTGGRAAEDAAPGRWPQILATGRPNDPEAPSFHVGQQPILGHVEGPGA